MKKCQICGKVGPTLCITQVVQGEVTELCLCEDCAKKKGLIDPLTLSFNEKFFPENLRNQIESLMKNVVAGAKHEIEEEKLLDSLAKTQCPVCGFTLADWRKTERLGCPDCYSSFAREMNDLSPATSCSIESAQVTPSPKLQLKLLAKKMEEAIAAEDYEEAARLRDEMKKYKD